jgi:hypothetical protein
MAIAGTRWINTPNERTGRRAGRAAGHRRRAGVQLRRPLKDVLLQFQQQQLSPETIRKEYRSAIQSLPKTPDILDVPVIAAVRARRRHTA